VVYCSALAGYASEDLNVIEAGKADTMKPLFDAILRHVPARAYDIDGPLQLQISALDYSSYVGKIGIGRIQRGRIRTGQQVLVLQGRDEDYPEGKAPEAVNGKIGQVLCYRGLERAPMDEAFAGDIVAITGIDELGIGSTLADASAAQALPMLRVDEPTMTMEFLVNGSPLAGREGKYVTSRQIRDRRFAWKTPTAPKS